MPRAETNLRTGRYREHRQNLTRFVESPSVAMKYSFFAELVMLWLDCAPENEEKVWTLLQYYMAGSRKLPIKTDTSSEEEEDGPLDIKAKDSMKAALSDFLTSEEIE
jgi:hypothetical protein